MRNPGECGDRGLLVALQQVSVRQAPHASAHPQAAHMQQQACASAPSGRSGPRTASSGRACPAGVARPRSLRRSGRQPAWPRACLGPCTERVWVVSTPCMHALGQQLGHPAAALFVTGPAPGRPTQATYLASYCHNCTCSPLRRSLPPYSQPRTSGRAVASMLESPACLKRRQTCIRYGAARGSTRSKLCSRAPRDVYCNSTCCELSQPGPAHLAINARHQLQCAVTLQGWEQGRPMRAAF